MAGLRPFRVDNYGPPVMAYFDGDRLVPSAVSQAIAKRFDPLYPPFDEVMASLHWDSLNGCWAFTYAGMFHGVEEDGYIHT